MIVVKMIVNYHVSTEDVKMELVFVILVIQENNVLQKSV